MKKIKWSGCEVEINKSQYVVEVVEFENGSVKAEMSGKDPETGVDEVLSISIEPATKGDLFRIEQKALDTTDVVQISENQFSFLLKKLGYGIFKQGQEAVRKPTWGNGGDE